MTLILCITSCSDSTGPADHSTINGSVVDQDGFPVENALIEISYYTEFLPDEGLAVLKKVNHSMSETLIQFSLAKKGHVKLWITRFRSADTISVLIDTVLSAGIHQVRFSGKDSEGLLLISDVYEFHLQTTGFYSSKLMVFSISDYSVFDDLNILDFYAKTDKKGHFEIDQSLLACNYDTVFTATDASGNKIGDFQISRYIKLWVLHDQYQASYMDSVYIDPTNGADVKIEMIQN